MKTATQNAVTRIGVIGVGYLGKFHAQKYAAMEGVELVGVADTNAEAAEKVAQTHKTAMFTDYRELLPLVDAVSIVVPTSQHYEVAQTVIDNGIDLLIEKPITTTITEADNLIEAAAAKGLILQVGHLERFNPAVMAMEEHLTHPLFVESHRIHEFKPRGTDVDVVLDLMIHDIDIIMNIVHSPIETIHTVGVPVVTPTTDIANARIIFTNGCTANVTVSRISQSTTRRLRVFQPYSFISVDYGKKEITVIKIQKGLGPDGRPRQELFQSGYAEKDALELELKDFVANVKNRSTPKVSGREGRNALAVAHEIMAQIREHADRHRDLIGL